MQGDRTRDEYHHISFYIILCVQGGRTRDEYHHISFYIILCVQGDRTRDEYHQMQVENRQLIEQIQRQV